MIIEKDNQLDDFLLENQNKDCFLIPILSDVNRHPLENTLCAVYVKIVDGDEGLLCFNHGETLKLNSKKLLTLDKLGRKFVRDKKQLNHIVKLEDVVDVNLQYYMSKNEPLDWDELSTNTHDYFYRVMWKMKNTNRIIPILKHLELCREQVKVLERYFDLPIHKEYNDEIIDSLSFVESSGLRKDDEMVYSEYNLFTSTGRPSNRFGGINFAALNKKDGSRKKFISRFKNGVLVEMDFDAYHLRLIADKLEYDFPKGSVHEHMAKFYGVGYEEAKALSFQYLYGYIPQNVVEINPYFSKVHNYIQELWNIYKNSDFIESYIYKRQIYKKNLVDMNANKLFNYTIQLMETENNMRVLSKLLPEIKDYQSKLILYSYDSFLLDFNMEDGLDYLVKVKDILEQDGKYPVKVSWGINYHEMKDITEKFV